MTNMTAVSIPRPQAVSGTVKWFDVNKGYGFVIADHFVNDFLLHQNVLENFGRKSVTDGATIDFCFEQLPNGMRVSEVLKITSPLEVIDETHCQEVDCVLSKRIPARVKWFDRTKGYGFVNQYGCAEDVFIGQHVLQNSGLQVLQSGQAVSIQIAEMAGRKTVHRIYDWVFD